MTIKFETLDDYLNEQLEDPEFRAEWEAQEPVYQLARLRIIRGLTQKELADKIGTQQPSIARLEGGKTEPTIPFLRRVAAALNARLEIRVIPEPPYPVDSPTNDAITTCHS
jgi:transcriptional regulator with XRE-family HTH domain